MPHNAWYLHLFNRHSLVFLVFILNKLCFILTIANNLLPCGQVDAGFYQFQLT